MAFRKKGLVGQTVLVLLWADILFKLAYWGMWLPLHAPDCDYWKHWEAARAMLRGDSPYYGGPDLYLGFNYPLFTGYLFIFLGFFTQQVSEVIWEVFNLLFSIGGGLIAWRYMRPAMPTRFPGEPNLSFLFREAVHVNWGTAVFVLVANFHPLLLNFMPGNIDPLNFVLFMGLGAALVRGREALAGVLLAALCLVKVAPVLLLVPIFFARRWRMLWTTTGLLALYLFHLLATNLWRTELFLYTDVLPRIGYHYLGISSSIHHVLANLVNPAAIASAEAYARWTVAINLVLLAVFVGACAVWSRNRARDFVHLMSFSMFMAVLMSPLLEYHHFVWAAPVLFFQVRDWVNGRISTAFALLCVVGWIALNSARIINDFVAMFPVSPLHWGSAIAIYLAVLCAWLAFRPAIQPPPSTTSPA